MSVSLRCQASVLSGAFRLLLLAIVPMLVMALPMCLLLGQLAAWYQARPLHVGEETVLTVSLSDRSPEMPDVDLDPAPGADMTIGPVRVPSEHMICWNLRAREDGYHQLILNVGGRRITKELAVGDGFMRVSLLRPAWSVLGALLHPLETPFPRDSIVQSVTIDYPVRDAWISGSNWWLLYWFAVSLATAFCLRPWLKVNM